MSVGFVNLIRFSMRDAVREAIDQGRPLSWISATTRHRWPFMSYMGMSSR
jgi:hypothetical protein